MFKLITTKWWDKPRFASQAVAKNDNNNKMRFDVDITKCFIPIQKR